MTTEACWHISLDCECPHCKKDVNLLDYVDFGEYINITIGEYDTHRTRDVPVVCPECYEEFDVKLTM